MKKEKFYNHYIQSLMPWCIPLLIVFLWQLFSFYGLIPTRTLPAPIDVVGAAFRLAKSGELFINIGISAARAITVFLSAAVLDFL